VALRLSRELPAEKARLPPRALSRRPRRTSPPPQIPPEPAAPTPGGPAMSTRSNAAACQLRRWDARTIAATSPGSAARRRLGRCGCSNRTRWVCTRCYADPGLAFLPHHRRPAPDVEDGVWLGQDRDRGPSRDRVRAAPSCPGAGGEPQEGALDDACRERPRGGRFRISGLRTALGTFFANLVPSGDMDACRGWGSPVPGRSLSLSGCGGAAASVEDHRSPCTGDAPAFPPSRASASARTSASRSPPSSRSCRERSAQRDWLRLDKCALRRRASGFPDSLTRGNFLREDSPHRGRHVLGEGSPPAARFLILRVRESRSAQAIQRPRPSTSARPHPGAARSRGR
jgi:hypothetical protein